MNVLYVDACMRGEMSRTRRLARGFLDALRTEAPDVTLTVHDLSTMALQPLDAASLAHREHLCNAKAWEDPSLRAAVELQRSDAVVIAAPYWDLSFPAALKVWVERMYVRNLTFVYRQDQPVGLCRAGAAMYLTTAGSPIGENDWGAGYLRAVMGMLGVTYFDSVRAEGLDLSTADPEAILQAALQAARAAVPRFLSAVKNAKRTRSSSLLTRI